MKLDEIGRWSEIKLEIIKAYSAAYTKILKNHPNLGFYYIDAFAGAGIHRRKKTGEYVLGSPLIALSIDPKFDHYFFIDRNMEKIEFLRHYIGLRHDVTIVNGDCNTVLIEDVFPRVKREDFRRALCFLDPYGMHLNWDVIYAAGQMKSVEIFINFPILDMLRNVLLKNPNNAQRSQVERMNTFCGGEWWRDYVYKEEIPDLFAKPCSTRQGINPFVDAFRARLKNVAGFKFAPEPLPMHNSVGGLLYYIYFATQNYAGNKIVKDIFRKHRRIG